MPSYWIEMPKLDDAADNLKKLRNMFRLKVYLFTHRPWPSEETHGTGTYQRWVSMALETLGRNPLPLGGGPRKLGWMRRVYNVFVRVRLKYGIGPLALTPIDVITRCWLRRNDIEYDELTIEKGSEDVSDPQGEFKNRFYISRKRKLRFFVEDDAEKASKLAYICDVVFLMNQPYNRSEVVSPRNIIRVNTWNDIYRWIRRLS